MRNQKKIVLIVLIVLMVVLLGGGIFAYTYFFTDTFINEQQGFYKYIAQNSKIAEMFKDEDIEKYLKKTQTNAYNNNGEISIAFSGDIDEEIKPTIDEIQKHKITFNGSVDNANKYAYEDLKLIYDNKEGISGAVINKNDYYGVKINEIGLNPYIVFENNNIKQFAKNLGLSDEEVAIIPDKIDLDTIYNKEIFTKKELEEIKDRYLKVIKENLTENMFSKTEQDVMDVYTLTITEDSVKTITIALIDTLKNDDLVLNRIKQLYTERQLVKEEEAQSLIEDLKKSLEESRNDIVLSLENNSGITSEDEFIEEQNSDESEKIYINVYVSERKLIKTEVLLADEVKILLTSNSNNVSLEFYTEDYTYTNMENQNTDNKYETIVILNLEKNKTPDEVSFIFTGLQDKNKQLFKSTLTFTGIKEMTNVTTTLSTDLYVYPEEGLLTSAQNSMFETKYQMEKENIMLALASLLSQVYQDTYTSENEFVVNETNLLVALQNNNLDMVVSINEDGNFKLQSNETGNTYIIDSKNLNIIDEIILPETQETQETEEKKEKIIILSANLNNTTKFETIQQQELTEGNMYKINDKSLEQIESLFTQLGDRVAKKMSNFYLNSPFYPIIFNTSSN